MIKPILFCALATFLLHANGFAQTPDKPCKDLQVQAEVQVASSGSNNGKITLKFSAGEKYTDYKLYLFGPRKDNRLDFSAAEIEDLPSGRYSLVVESKKDTNYCLKQFTLKL